MPLFYVKIRKNIDICNYLPIYYPAICRGWGTFSVPSQGAGVDCRPLPNPPQGAGVDCRPLPNPPQGAGIHSHCVLGGCGAHLPLGEGWDGASLRQLCRSCDFSAQG